MENFPSMNDDIVTRLREAGLCGWNTQQEAADEIERLRSELLILIGASDLLYRSVKSGTNIDGAVELYETKPPIRDFRDWK